MKITAWRIFKPKHASTAFKGDGARLYGGRWSSRGTQVVYAAGSQSLAALEMLVHLLSTEILAAYRVRSVVFEHTLVEKLDFTALPSDWRSSPAPAALQAIGNQWAHQKRSAVLQVPSAIVADEFNYLFNPEHRDFAKIVIGKATEFRFDSRLVK